MWNIKIPYPLIILPNETSFFAIDFCGINIHFNSYRNKWSCIIKGAKVANVYFDTKIEAEDFSGIVHAAVELAIKNLSIIDLRRRPKPDYIVPELEPLCDIFLNV